MRRYLHIEFLGDEQDSQQDLTIQGLSIKEHIDCICNLIDSFSDIAIALDERLGEDCHSGIRGAFLEELLNVVEEVVYRMHKGEVRSRSGQGSYMLPGGEMFVIGREEPKRKPWNRRKRDN